MSGLPPAIETILWPYRVVGHRVAVVAVLLTAAVCGGSLIVAADAVAGSVDGTTTIENPDRPPEWVCEQQEDSEFGASERCNLPAEIDVSRSVHAAESIQELLPGTLLALGGLWLFFAGLLVSGEARFGEVLFDTAWALPPLALPAVARVVVAVRTAPTHSWPESLDALATEARLVALGETSIVVTVAAAVAAVWIGIVLYGVGRDVARDEWLPALAVAGSLLVAAGIPLDVPESDLLLAGVAVVVVSLPFVFAPRIALQLSARGELIGYRGADGVEPKGWYVRLNQLFGLAGFAGGLLLAWLPAYLV